MDMKWGFFSHAHIATLVLASVMIVGLYYFLKGRKPALQQAVLLPFSLLGVGAIVFNLVRWDAPLEYLPLHLCSINAMLLPVVVLTRNKTLGNLLLVWCLGALAALVINFEMADTVLFGEAFIAYYFPHVFEFGVPILLFKLKLVEKDSRCIGSTIGITMAIYTVVHVCNKLINFWCASQGLSTRVNYMFSIEPSNPLVALFHQIIPYEYWHMYMVLPIVAVYLIIVYTPELAARRTEKLRHKTV